MQLLRMRPEKVQTLKSVRGLSELSRMIVTKRSGVYTSSTMKHIHKITHNSSLIETGGKLGSVNSIFQLVRKTFHLSEKGKVIREYV